VRIKAVGPQIDLITCPLPDVFYGGARGGMKTYGLILDFVAHANRYGRAARGILFRRTYDELEEVERICRDEILGGVWEWSAARRTWTAPNGATLKLRYLDRDEDAGRYLGHQYTRVYVDEAGLFPSPAPIDLLFGSLRSPEGVPVGRRLTGNPGGPGHHWLKARYIAPAPPWTPFRYQPQPELRPDWTLEAVFIPARLDDNPFLKRDPDYERRLAAAGGPHLFRAWRYGDWDVQAGQALEIVPAKHLVQPFKVPDHWRLFGAFDWGYAHWWVFGWYAVNEDGRIFCLDTIRGRRMRDPEIIITIKRRAPWQRLSYIVAGHDCWSRPRLDEDGPTTAERFAEAGLVLTKANTDRVMGLRNLREMLAFKGPNGEPEDPRFVWFDTPGNRRSMQAVQAMAINPDDPEDVLKTDADYDTGKGGDDDYDQLRYALASRPAIPASTWKQQIPDAWAPEVLAVEAARSRRVKRHRAKDDTGPVGITGTYI